VACLLHLFGNNLNNLLVNYCKTNKFLEEIIKNQIDMKQLSIRIALVTMAFLLVQGLTAQTAFEVKSHSIVVSGTSNLHDWTADVLKAKGVFNIKVENNKIADIQGVELKVDAQSFNSSKGSIMNSKIKDAINSKKHPEINFKATKLNSITEKGGVVQINSSGVLTIAGTSQNITIDAVGKVLPSGEIELTGSKKVKMTDYKVEPPTAMFGALTTGDEVTITFKVVLKSI